MRQGLRLSVRCVRATHLYAVEVGPVEYPGRPHKAGDECVELSLQQWAWFAVACRTAPAFQDKPDVYNHFLNIMKDFKSWM